MFRAGGFWGRVLLSRYYTPFSIVLALALLLGTGANLLLRSGAQNPVFLQPHSTIAITGPGVTSTPRPLEAYVLGAVLRPGAYTLYEGAQVRDLVVTAGGLFDNADITRVKPAATLVDRQSISVPRLGEQAPVELGGRINLNTASATELHNALNVTTAIANRIVAYRAAHAHAPFSAVNQLLLVPVSQTTNNRINELVAV